MFEPGYKLIATLLPYSWAQADFMLRALIGLILLAPLCGGMGIIAVNFRMAFFSDAISHSAFTGVALGLLFNLNPQITLVVFGLLVGVAITGIKRQSELSVDTIIGVFFSFIIALGIALISVKGGLVKNMQVFLYGDILSISDVEILVEMGLFILIMGYLYISYNRLFFIGLNETLAYAQGIKVSFYEYTFTGLLSLLVAVSVRAVGLLLVTAMLVLPAASSRNIARTAGGLFWWSVGFAMISAIAGLFASIAWNTATGATVILAASLCFFITALWKMLFRR